MCVGEITHFITTARAGRCFTALTTKLGNDFQVYLLCALPVRSLQFTIERVQSTPCDIRSHGVVLSDQRVYFVECGFVVRPLSFLPLWVPQIHDVIYGKTFQ